MRRHAGVPLLSLLLLLGCEDLVTSGYLASEIKSDPSILVLGVGETKAVVVEAFLGNQPESVTWNVGNVGVGLDVVEDSSYGSVYVGNELTLPPQSHSRRFQVTMHDSVETSFVISGGTGVVTIPVRPPTPAP